jgi:DNA-binding NarL/FixJ family response regulator
MDGLSPTRGTVQTYGARQVPPNGLPFSVAPQNSRVNELSAREAPETTVLVAVGSATVREALVAMLGAIDGFSVVCDADSADSAIECARRQRPRLALIEPELSEGGGWWVIQQIRSEQLACVVVALGQRADGTLAQLVGAQSYVQMGIAPRDLLSTLEAAMAYRTPPLSGSAEAESHLLPDSDPVLEKPALVDL